MVGKIGSFKASGKAGIYLLLGIAIALSSSLVASAAPVDGAPADRSDASHLWIESIGLVAGFGTTFAALPDCWEMIKARSAKGMNPRMAAITGTFQILWLVYGLLIAAPAVIFWNAIAIVTNAATVSAFLYFSWQEKSR